MLILQTLLHNIILKCYSDAKKRQLINNDQLLK